MKKLKKILLILLIIIVIIIAGGYIYVQSLAKSGMPDYNATVEIEGLKEEVKVYRDEFGIPHIYAQNEDDLYLVTGYISAQDRIWQMDFLRRVTQGRLSEIIGEGMIENDVILRSLRIPEKSKMVIDSLNSEILNALEFYSKGVNQYLEDYSDDLPFEFTVFGYEPEKWEPEHSVNLLGYMAWSLETGWGMESKLFKLKNVLSEEKFLELIPDLNLQNPVIFPDFNGELDDSILIAGISNITKLAPEIFKGSNNWVISGEKSSTGSPLLANDAHLGLMIPGIWTQMHQHVEGKLNVSGLILPGQPFFVLGHNSDIAWGMTNVMTDGADFYVETINPDNENQYKLNGEWKDLQIREEKITVKGMEEPIIKVTKYTHRGPIISGFKDIEDKVVSMHWIGNEYSNEIQGIYLFNRAKNWDDFRNACRGFISASQNIIYADKEGNIGLQCAAGLAVRKGNPYFFYPGDTTEFDWQGIVPFDSLPYSYNPECGYILSANNRTVNGNYNYYISAWFDLPNRAKRIEQMLTEKDKYSVEDFKSMQNDAKSILAVDLLPTIIKSIEEIPDLNEQEKKSLKLLKDWDYIYSKEKVAPTIFEALYMKIGENILLDDLKEELYNQILNSDLYINYLIDKISKTEESFLCDDINTEEKETFSDMIKISFSEVFEDFREQNDSDLDKTKWGDVHKVNLIQPIGNNGLMNFAFNLNRVIPINGSYHTVNATSYKFSSPYFSDFGPSHRHVYTPNDFDKSFTIIPTGVSGIPGSDYYCDQTEMYVNGEYHGEYFSKEKVKEKKVYESTFVPKK